MTTAATTLLHTCRIAPPPHTVADQSLQLTFLDFLWLKFHPIRRLLFYELPDSSKPYFLQTLVPNLKESLSITLKHFFPLAGKIICPLNSKKIPEIRYRTGDSVSLTFFESSDDFDNLVGNHARDADKFYDFIPMLSQSDEEESDQKVLEVLAIRVTLFSGRGLCIGLSNHHGVGDASSIVGFIRSWALVNKLGGEKGWFLNSDTELPVFDRAMIKYDHELDSVLLNQVEKIPMAPPSFPLPTDRVRATYVFTDTEIKKLKNLVLEKIPGLGYVSSFVVVAAYVWNCFARSLIAGDEEKSGVVSDDEPEFFLFAVDSRARIDPPVPGNYFGNVLTYGLPRIGHLELVGEEGFFKAAEAIAGEIKNRVVNNNNILGGAENWLAEVGFAFQNRVLSVSGSARVDLYGADFGWGKARKLESLSIDGERYAMSLCKSRDCEGGLEVGLSLSKGIMDAFAALFCDGMKGE